VNPQVAEFATMKGEDDVAEEPIGLSFLMRWISSSICFSVTGFPF